MDITFHHKVDIYIHDERPGGSAILQDIVKRLGVIQGQGSSIMGKVEQARQELVEINEATNRQAEATEAIAAVQTELAADVEALVTKAESGSLEDSDIETLRAVKAKIAAQAEASAAQATFLRGVADRYTPEAPAGGGEGGGEAGGVQG